MRNKLLTIIALNLLIVSCQRSIKVEGPSLNWFSDWDQAASLAKKSGRQMIAEFSTSWCPYCQYIEEKVFTKPQVAEKIKNFILVRLDGDAPATQNFMDKYSIKGFPTFIVFGPGGSELQRFNDINSTSELLTLLEDIESDKSGHKELKEAGVQETTEAYKKAYDILASAKDPKLEDALAGLLETSKDNAEEARKYALELIEKFSNSPFIPDYYKKLSQSFSADAIRQLYLKQAGDKIENRLKNIKKLDERTLRITLDQHIDLLADIYKELKQFSKISVLYQEAGALCEDLISKSGGALSNKHMVGTTVYYYLNAQAPNRALDFLHKAEKTLPDYWPVYSSYAKVYIAMNDFDKAANYARKGYGLAEDVAKPKLALIWAEALALKRDYKAASDVLKTAESDLLKTGASESGRAAKVLSQLKAQLAEYSAF